MTDHAIPLYPIALVCANVGVAAVLAAVAAPVPVLLLGAVTVLLLWCLADSWYRTEPAHGRRPSERHRRDPTRAD
jgi:hypothetical protein